MPETPNTQGSPRLLTVPEITERYGISRQAIHAYRQRGVFPQPAAEKGSTRLRFRDDEVNAFFAANPKRPGRRTDRQSAPEGEPVTTTIDPRIAILSALNDPPYNQVAEKCCIPWGEAEKMLNAYRAAVVTEVTEALTAKAQELSAQAEEELRRDLEDEAQVWHEAAEVVRKVAQPERESSDG